MTRLCPTRCGLTLGPICWSACVSVTPSLCFSSTVYLHLISPPVFVSLQPTCSIFNHFLYLQIESNSVKFGSVPPPHSPSPVISWILVAVCTRDSSEADQQAVPPRCSECLSVWRKHIPLHCHHFATRLSSNCGRRHGEMVEEYWWCSLRSIDQRVNECCSSCSTSVGDLRVFHNLLCRARASNL